MVGKEGEGEGGGTGGGGEMIEGTNKSIDNIAGES